MIIYMQNIFSVFVVYGRRIRQFENLACTRTEKTRKHVKNNGDAKANYSVPISSSSKNELSSSISNLLCGVCGSLPGFPSFAPEKEREFKSAETSGSRKLHGWIQQKNARFRFCLWEEIRRSLEVIWRFRHVLRKTETIWLRSAG